MTAFGALNAISVGGEADFTGTMSSVHVAAREGLEATNLRAFDVNWVRAEPAS
jgi:hypothetical protein